MDSTINYCRKNGYVNNIFGRRCHVPGINNKNFNIRNFQERAAINAPIQGSAADIMRLAMIRLKNKLSKLSDVKIKMLLQIHDELIFESPKNKLSEIIPIIKAEMSNVTSSEFHSFSLPLTVDVSYGENWGLVH